MGKLTVSEAVPDSGGMDSITSTVNIQAGRAKLVLSILQSPGSIKIRIQQMTPDLTEVGSNLEEAKALRQEHDDLVLKLNLKQNEVAASIASDGDETKKQLLADAWKDITKQLENRKILLDQSVAFHSSALQFVKKMQHAEAKCADVPLAHDVDGARRLLQQHQDLRKTVLEASMMTLQEGQLLLDRIRKVALGSDVQNRHCTTSGCYAIEQLLLGLQDKKYRLEELWFQRKLQLEQCIQMLIIKEEADKITKWMDEVGDVSLAKKDLGDSLDTANILMDECLQIDEQFATFPQTLKHLTGSLDYLTSSVPADRDAIRQNLQSLEVRCDNFVSRLNVKRRNLSLAAHFFVLAQESSHKLEGLEVLLSSLEKPVGGAATSERHAQISQAISDATVATLHIGRSILGRVGKEDPSGKAIDAKVAELQEHANRLQGLCPLSDDDKENEAVNQLLEKLSKLNSWLVFVGQASINRYHELSINLSDVNDFLISHRGLAEEVKVKHNEAKSLLATAEELTKAEKKGAAEAEVKAKKLSQDFELLATISEKRSKIALAFIVLQKRERQLSTQLQLLEKHLREERTDPSQIPESSIRQREEAVRKLATDCTDIDRIGKQFITDVNDIKPADKLSTDFVINAVSVILSNFADRKSIVSNYFEHWKAYATEGGAFRVQWKQFMQEARKTIDWVIKIEDNFFPKLAGELGSTISEIQHHQKRLEEFKPTIKKVQEDTEKHLKTAELLSLKGDTRGQRDFIVNELLKMHTRFQARVGEYRYLLNMAAKFFENLKQLDQLIETTEKEYASEELPKEVSSAETILRQHEGKRIKLQQFIDYSSREADQIVIRVRQQDSEEVAKDEVRRVLQMSEEKRRQWEDAWEDHKRRLEQSLQLCQFYFDIKKLQNGIDELQRQLDSRQGSYGNSLSVVKMTIQAFLPFERMADLIGGKVGEFDDTANRMTQDRHYDSRRIRHEVDDMDNKWNTFYNSIKNYRLSLESSTKFFDLMNDCEGWINDAGQFLLGISRQAPHCKSSADTERLITEIVNYRKDGGMKQDGRLQGMECIATDLYGSVVGPEKMQHILDRNQEMYNAFIKAIEELRVLQNNLTKTELILVQVGRVVEQKAPRQPRFVQPLQNAEISEGQRFTFECRLECDTAAPTIVWLRENEPVKGFVASYKDGLCRLTIEETLIGDSAKYTCKVITDAGEAETSASLKVKEAPQRVIPPDITKQLKPAEVPEGTSHTFECIITGVPFPTLTWFKDGVALANSPEYVMTIDNGRCCMKIRKLTKEHSAKYTCKASNPGGDASTSATLSVIAVKKPEFTEPLKDMITPEGKTIKLECRYNGEPAPQIQWLFNDSPILPSAIFKIKVEENYTSLEIHEVFSEDCGTYATTARNLGGEAHTSCLVALVGTQPTVFTMAPMKPQFTTELQTRHVQEGTRARLDCVVTGYPFPEISWFHNDKPIKKTKDFDLTYDMESGRCSLLIHEVYLEDSGNYLCLAVNPHGSAKTGCRLNVEPLLSDLSDSGAVSPGEVPPKFTQLLKDIEGVEGELVRFECRVIGHPTPTIKWYSGRNQITSTQDFQIFSERELQTLTIPTAHKEDAGNYMVKANNNAGIAKCYATLIIKPLGDKHAMKMRLIESSHSIQTETPIEGHSPPEILKSFHDIHVRPGQPCTMEVVIVGRPKPKIEWLFNNEPIVSPDYKISSFGDMYSLHIPEVFDEDAGRFSVIAENDAGKAWVSALLVVVDMSQILGDFESPPETPLVQQSLGYGPPPVVPKQAPKPAAVPVEVPMPPKFFESLRNLVVEEGTRVTLEGIVEGKPEPVIRWYKEGRQLSDGPDFEISCHNGRARLTIASAMEVDSGNYSCVAQNKGGEASSTSQLIVKGTTIPPQFVEKLQSKSVKEGQRAQFSIRVTGKPAPEVTWYREGMQIFSSPDFTITKEGNLHTLTIPEVFYEDSGNFTVKANSPGGQIQCSADLIVEAPPKAPAPMPPQAPAPTPPKFLKPLHNLSAQAGQRVTLECVTRPIPPPEKIQWFHNEVELFISPQHQMSYADGVCSLTLDRVTPAMSGRYVCTVLINGLPGSSKMDLEVCGVPEKEPQAPQFGEKLKNVETAEGRDVLFVCRVAGHPPPTVQWFHLGRLVRPSKRHEIRLTNDGVATLLIRAVQPEDSGVYTCSATNDFGQEYCSAEMFIEVSNAVDETSYVSQDTLRRIMSSPGHSKLRELGGVSEQFFKPIFRKIPNDLEVPEGQMARFDSVVAGRPIPDMLWFRDGTQVFDGRLHKIVINEEGINSLIFDATALSDAGHYTCIARNRAGEDRFQVNLNVLSRQMATPPRFLSRLSNQTAIIGQPITFTVELEGVPAPMVSWQKDNSHIVNSDHYQIQTSGYRSTLYIPFVTVEDNAWFQCTAASTSGTVINRARLIVQVEAQDYVSTRQAVITSKSVSPAPRRAVSAGRITSPSHQSAVTVVLSPTPTRTTSEMSLKTETHKTQTQTIHAGKFKASTESLSAPQLIEPMKDQQVVEGGSAQFRCRIYSATEPTHEWLFNDRPLNPSNRHRFLAEGGVYILNMTGVNADDGGIYKCVVRNQGGEVTCIAHLRVGSQLSRSIPRHELVSSQAPHVTRPITDVTTNVGSPAKFEVVLSGNPLPDVLWFIEGQQIHNSDNFQISRSGDVYSLLIKNVQPLTAGKITCMAVNQSGSVESSANLSVRGSQVKGNPPRFTKPLTDFKAADGSEVILTCTVAAQPAAQLSWFHNGKNIDKSTDFAISYDDHTGVGELVIVDCMSDDQGRFKCVARNDVGSAETECLLTVTAPQKPVGEETRVEQAVVSRSVPATGSTVVVVQEETIVPVVLESRVAGQQMQVVPPVSPVAEVAVVQSQQFAVPHVTMEPAKEEPIVQESVQKKQIVIPGVGGQVTTTTTVVSSQISQGPQQILVTEFGGGRDMSTVDIKQTTVVDVVSGQAPKFTQPIQPCVVIEGQPCIFAAVFSGDPRPTIEWLKEKEILAMTERHTTAFDGDAGSCSLTIANCQQVDTGVYSCRASNTAGRATCTANVVVVRE